MYVACLTYGVSSYLHRATFYVAAGRVAQSVVRLTQESEVPGSIPGPATYFRFSFR